jgi:hypothetical protein
MASNTKMLRVETCSLPNGNHLDYAGICRNLPAVNSTYVLDTLLMLTIAQTSQHRLPRFELVLHKPEIHIPSALINWVFRS